MSEKISLDSSVLTIKKGGKNGTCKNKLKLVAEYF